MTDERATAAIVHLPPSAEGVVPGSTPRGEPGTTPAQHRQACIHEAAHLLAARSFSWRVGEVVVSRGGIKGRAILEAPEGRSLGELIERAIVAVCGEAAVERFRDGARRGARRVDRRDDAGARHPRRADQLLGGRAEPPAARDGHEAPALARSRGRRGSQAVQTAFLEIVEHKAAGFARKHEDGIRHLATLLEKHGRLDADEARFEADKVLLLAELEGDA